MGERYPQSSDQLASAYLADDSLLNEHPHQTASIPFSSRIPVKAGSRASVPQRVSRDEMNLAEFPLTILSTRNGSATKTLEFTDSIRGKNGDLITRSWIITGADKFGLPTASDDEVILGLLKLTVDGGFEDRKVHFTRYELLKILRWSTEGRSYSRLQKALDRLSGVRIKAANAFYDNESKSHSTRNFGLIDAYEINDGRSTDPKPSFFIWSEVLFKSFQVGFIKKFDLDFYLNLRSAVSRRLYRYLDKHFWYRARVQNNLFTLAHEKIGISRNYQYASSLRQQIDPAVEELVAQGFLAGCEYIGRGKDTEIVLFAGSSRPRSQGTQAKPVAVEAEVLPRKKVSSAPGARAEHLVQSIEDDPHAQRAHLVSKLVDQLTERGLKPNQAEQLLTPYDLDTLERVQKIILHFDGLCQANSKLVSRSPVGFLYRAVQRPHEFSLPQDQRQGQFPFQPRSEPARGQERHTAAAHNGPNQNATTARKQESGGPTQGEYLVYRRRELDALRSSIDDAMHRKIEGEVRSALVRIQGLISPQRFEEAVRHGVDEKLARLFAVSDFEEWSHAVRRTGKNQK